MSSNWFFTKDGRKRIGPFTGEQLRQLATEGLLSPSDMVLKEGERKWEPAGSIQGLFSPSSLVSTSGPVVLPVASQFQPASPDDPKQPVQAAGESDQLHRVKKRMFWRALLVVGVLLVTAFVIVLAAADWQTRIAFGLVAGFSFVIVVMVGWVIGLIYIATDSFYSCPRCGRWWARVYLRKKFIEKKKCYGLVTRRAFTRSSGSVSGTGHHWGQADYQDFSGSTYSSGSTSWKERAPVIRTTYELHYQCKYCRAGWTEEKIEQVEDFDIERE